MVLFLRFSSHDFSLGESISALRILGRSAGHLTSAGAYPSGALGSARTTRSKNRLSAFDHWGAAATPGTQKSQSVAAWTGSMGGRTLGIQDHPGAIPPYRKAVPRGPTRQRQISSRVNRSRPPEMCISKTEGRGEEEGKIT